MMDEETSAIEHLGVAKLNAKAALRVLDPNPADPVTVHILRVIDASDVAVKAIVRRSELARKPMGSVGPPDRKEKSA